MKTINDFAFDLITDELQKAKSKFPQWPTDIIHAAAIVAEEAGELVRAAVQVTYEKKSITQALNEAVHTAATAIRFIENYQRMSGYRVNNTYDKEEYADNG